VKVTRGKRAYKFSDVLMVPMNGNVTSRDTPSLYTSIKGIDFKLHFKLPFIASPMKGIVGTRLIKEMDNLGGIGILHKFWNEERHFIEAVERLSETRYGIAIGIDLKHLEYCQDAAMIVIDVANGYTNKYGRAVETVKNRYPSKIIVAGNVVTAEGAVELKRCGADLIRTGIGNGFLCRTRDVTGVGYPQLSAVYECAKTGIGIVADGGMPTSGDMAKALAAGALFCMLGSPLAAAYESTNNGTIYGMGSSRLHIEMNKKPKSIEGIEIESDKTNTLHNIINQYAYGIKSAMTYLNAATLTELRNNVTWVEI